MPSICARSWTHTAARGRWPGNTIRHTFSGAQQAEDMYRPKSDRTECRESCSDMSTMTTTFNMSLRLSTSCL
jgi:hypothetical protein